MESYFNATGYLLKGASLLLKPGYRRFILIPVVSNLILFAFFMVGIVTYLSTWMDVFYESVHGWLSFLGVLLWIVFAIGVLFLYSLSFTSITNLIAAPFNGFLAEKIWEDQTGEPIPEEALHSMITRTLGRELCKLAYFIFWGLLIAIGLLILGLIPLLNLAVPILGLMWTCWVFSIQYVDYAADNKQIDFYKMKAELRSEYGSTLSFGLTIFIAMMIPILNIFVMSAAVAGGVLYWIDLNKLNSQK